MKERPIIFSASMVNAILDGRKTQTRRVVKDTKNCDTLKRNDEGGYFFENNDGSKIRGIYYPKCPYGKVGDRLWVRETWSNDCDHHWTLYRADNKALRITYGESFDATDSTELNKNPKWKPSIHMPRWASRITLEITDIRVERLNDISEADAQAEGLEKYKQLFKDYSKKDNWYGSAVNSFWTLWESINGEDSWDKNPWVWVVEFKMVN